MIFGAQIYLLVSLILWIGTESNYFSRNVHQKAVIQILLSDLKNPFFSVHFSGKLNPIKNELCKSLFSFNLTKSVTSCAYHHTSISPKFHPFYLLCSRSTFVTDSLEKNVFLFPPSDSLQFPDCDFISLVFLSFVLFRISWQ